MAVSSNLSTRNETISDKNQNCSKWRAILQYKKGNIINQYFGAQLRLDKGNVGVIIVNMEL